MKNITTVDGTEYEMRNVDLLHDIRHEAIESIVDTQFSDHATDR
jgi:hypothetical protein